MGISYRPKRNGLTNLPRDGAKLVDDDTASRKKLPEICGDRFGKFTRASLPEHWQWICTLAQPSLSVANLSFAAPSKSTAWFVASRPSVTLVKTISHLTLSPARTHPRSNLALTSIICKANVDTLVLESFFPSPCDFRFKGKTGSCSMTETRHEFFRRKQFVPPYNKRPPSYSDAFVKYFTLPQYSVRGMCSLFPCGRLGRLPGIWPAD